MITLDLKERQEILNYKTSTSMVSEQIFVYVICKIDIFYQIYLVSLTSNKETQLKSMLSNHLSHSNRYSKGQPLYNYLTLDFKEDVSTFGRFRSNKLYKSHKQPNNFYKTLYNKQSPFSQRKQSALSSNRRSTSMTNRNNINSTHFSPYQLNNPEINSIYPSLDIQRYKYLMKAISSISKTRKLPQFRQQTSVKREKRKSRENGKSLSGQQSQNNKNKKTKEVKLQIGFQSHSSPISKGKSQNAFQKLFKNKQLLLRGRNSPSRPQETENFSLKFLGEEDLHIIQMSKHPRKPKPRIAV